MAHGFRSRFDALDLAVSRRMFRFGVPLARWSLGIVFFWFGILKPLGLSSAEELVRRTVYWGVDPDWFVPLLGYWEMAIGVCLIDPGRWLGLGPWMTRIGILLLFLQMPGTFLPLVLLPDVCFTQVPHAPTIEGQYIIKNIVLIAAALVIGGTVRKEVISDQ